MKNEYLPLKNEPLDSSNWKFLPLNASKKEKKYILEMFPYPSGQLHMGHVRNYSIGDVQARYYQMNGYEVHHPMGFDSFGLPAENAAIKNNVNPLKWTEQNIQQMKVQLDRLGCSYNWDNEISTSRSNYYAWNQWLFKKLYEAGLIYRKQGIVNWDPVDKTVLANEQVIDGKGWRSGAIIEKKSIEQWYIKITQYADELLDALDDLDGWPERVKNMQRQWIGKNNGTLVQFNIDHPKVQQSLGVFTTRPDTLYGATYVAIAPEHTLLPALLPLVNDRPRCEAYIQDSLKKTIDEKTNENKTKSGIDTGLNAIHPLTSKKIPIFIADYVLTDYGTGAVMAVPAHDERDCAFATTFNLPIIEVIQGKTPLKDGAYTGPGQLIHSDEFNGLSNTEAKEQISKKLVSLGKGTITPQYKLRDWLISRQRYWGTPIPMMYDSEGNFQPVPDTHLPVTLPTDVTFSGSGNPIETSPSFNPLKTDTNTFQKETDTMDTFFDSSWYFMRFCDPTNSNAPFDSTKVNQLLPVDYYIGGIEHACLHLLYARFFTKALRDMGLHNIDEPFKQLVCQGMVLKDGAKMSKSQGNTVDPNVIIKKYGADTARIFILFGAPVEKDLDWSDEGVEGSFRFSKRFFNMTANHEDYALDTSNTNALEKHVHKVIQKMTHDIEHFQFNTAISQLMELMNTISKIGSNKNTAITMTKLIAPFAPFIAENVWKTLGQTNSVHEQPWPTFDPALTVEDDVTIVIQVNGKVRDKINQPRNTPEDILKEQALSQERIQKNVENKTIIKTIVVPDRLINFVVR